MRLASIFIIAAAAAVLAGCATTSAPAGKYLVYRDAAGNITRQFDYPSNDLCGRVQRIAGGAKCQADSLSAGLKAQATLRYSPPGLLVQAYYPDMGRCQADTRQLAAGVEVVNACSVH